MTTFNGFFITGDAIQAHHRRRGDRKNSGGCNKSLKSILTKKNQRIECFKSKERIKLKIDIRFLTYFTV